MTRKKRTPSTTDMVLWQPPRADQPPTTAQPRNSRNIRLDQLFINNGQIFIEREDVWIDDLVASIRRCGMLSPILVRPTLDGLFELLAGRRRFYAACELRWTEIPALDVSSDAATEELAVLSSDICQRRLKPMDEIIAIVRFREILEAQGDLTLHGGARVKGHSCGKSLTQAIAERVGVSPRKVQMCIRIAKAIVDVQEALRRGEITLHQAEHAAGLTKEKAEAYLRKLALERVGPRRSGRLAKDPRAKFWKDIVDRIAEEYRLPAPTRKVISEGMKKVREQLELLLLAMAGKDKGRKVG